MKARALSLLVPCALALAMTPVMAGQDIQYQRRGNRSEGIKPKPVSGYDVELLSALVDTQEDMSRFGPTLGFRFFLKEPVGVYPLVKELETKHYYVLDNVQPATPWRVGYGNVFEWPTDVVLARLSGFKPSELGVVVRLGKATPSVDENVAPAIFYQSKPAGRIRGYLFTFSLRDDGNVTAKVFREGQETEVFSQRQARQSRDRPFTVNWALANAAVPEGRYRLVLSGYFLATNKPIQQTVRFYHRPEVAEYP
jgi:hypothetical protein